MIPKNTFSGFGTWTLDDLKFGLGSRGISERPLRRFAIEYDGYMLVDAFAAYRMSAALDLSRSMLSEGPELADKRLPDYQRSAEPSDFLASHFPPMSVLISSALSVQIAPGADQPPSYLGIEWLDRRRSR